MTRAFYENELTTTPVHVELSAGMATNGSIILAPIRSRTTATAPHMQVPRPFGVPTSNPMALISVHLSDVKTAQCPAMDTVALKPHAVWNRGDQNRPCRFFPGLLIHYAHYAAGRGLDCVTRGCRICFYLNNNFGEHAIGE